MKNITHLTIILLAFTLAFSACKKADNASGTNGNYYVKFKFDGIAKTLTSAHGGITNGEGGVYGAAIYGKFSNDSAKESNILILDSLPMNTTKTYRCILVKANGTNDVPQALFTYYDEHNARYVATYLGYITGPHPDQQINVKFSEITQTYMKGSFAANAELYGEKQPYVLHPITEGEFYIKRDY